MFTTLTKPSVTAAVLLGTLALAACGESGQEKAAKQVCSARNGIAQQIGKLEGLTLSASTITEARTGFEAISSDLKKIKDQQSALAPARKEQVEAATRIFETELSSIAGDLLSSLTSGNIEAQLKNAQPQLKAALSKLGSDYKQALGPISCS